jgi:hypothetical protein
MSVALTLFSTLACSHTEPFAVDDHNLNRPFESGSPARLTWAEGDEVAPAWVPGGTSFIYAFRFPESSEGDGCLGVLNAAGGQMTRTFCYVSEGQADSVDTLAWPAVSADGRVAYVHSSRLPLQDQPSVTRLIVSPLEHPTQRTIVRALPFTGPDGAFFVGLTSTQWLGAERLAFLGQVQEVVIPCPGCDAQVIRRPAGILTVSVEDGAVAVAAGTTDVTGIAAGPTPDQLYLTRDGESRIFLRTLSTGVETEAHGFEGGTVGGLSVTGTMAATWVDGELRILDLATRAERVVAGLPLFLDQPIVTAGGDTLIGVGARLEDPFELGSSIWQVALP